MTLETTYHPATRILIEGLKDLPGGHAIIAKWDIARAKIDAQFLKNQTTETKSP